MAAEPSDAEQRLIDEARTFVGAPPKGERHARLPVNLAMINQWTDALDDRSPAYVGDDPIAPPAMLGSWTLGGKGISGVWTARGESPVALEERGPRDHVMRRMEAAGFTSVVAVSYEQTYLRPLRPGDLLSETLTVEDISERKETALGTGYFVTVRHDYLDQNRAPVGIARMRLLQFQPPQRPGNETTPPQAAPKRARPPVNRDNAFFWEGVAHGELRIQRCADCSQLRHPPRPMCSACQSTAWDTVTSTGRGEIYSYATHHHPPLPGIKLPLTAVLVALEEGVRIVSTLTGTPPDDVRIGMPVEVVFEDVDQDLVLPVFRARVAETAS